MPAIVFTFKLFDNQIYIWFNVFQIEYLFD